MILGWMVYAILIAGLLTVAAIAIEWALHAFRRPTRWIWVTAIALGVLGPLAVLAAGGSSDPAQSRSQRLVGGAPAKTAPYLPTPSAVLRLDDPSSLSRLDRPLVMGWLLTSMLLAARYGVFLVVIARRRRGWRIDNVDGISVRFAPDLGPAVVGFLSPAIILPEWIRSLDQRLLRLVVAHEQEHVDKGDTRLLIAAGVLVVLVPWNLALWWQSRRLRLAIEIDCDRRVLASAAEVAPYAGLLCEIGAMRNHSRLEAISLGQSALIRPAAFLESRIRHMTAPVPRHRTWKALGVGTFAIVLLGFATVPDPPPISTAEGQQEYRLLTADIEYRDARSVTELPSVSVVAPAQDGRPERRWEETHEAYEGMAIVDRQVITPEEFCYTTRESDGSVQLHTRPTAEVDSLNVPAGDHGEVVSGFLSDLHGGKRVEYMTFTREPSVCFLLKGEIEGLEPAVPLGIADSAPSDTTDSHSVRIRCQEGCYPADIRRFFEARVGPVACNILVGLRIDPGGRVDRVNIVESAEIPICDVVAEEWARSTRWSLSRDIEDWPIPVWIHQPIRYSPLEG
jgi:hypothetical protein